MKTLCIYNYFEKNKSYKDNCLFFLNYGLNEYSDFIIIVNGISTITFPLRENLKVMYRENKGYDFMAYSYVLNRINISYYDYYFFINTSVKGPYTNIKNWQQIFIDLFVDDVKLVGTTINIFCGKPGCGWPYEYKLNNLGLNRPYTHVQSMMFAMDRECLLYLKDRIFTEIEIKSFSDTILYKEIMMSQFILYNNWNIDCVAPLYQGYDYRLLKYDINFSSNCGDPCYKNGYFGKTLQPEDVVFIKTNRDIHFSYFSIRLLTTIAILLMILVLYFIIRPAFGRD